MQLASSLTFTTLLAMVPLFTVSLMLLSVFPSSLTPNIDEVLAAHVLPDLLGKTIKSYFGQVSLRSVRLTALGTLLLIASAIVNMMTIERAFNAIWRVPHPRPTAQRVVIYWAVLTLGPILIGASLTMTSYLASASMGLARAAPLAAEIILWLLPIVLTVSAFTLLYKLVPARRVTRRHALIGGLVAGLLFEAAKRGFALYVVHSPNYSMAYGGFAAVPVFLLWIYLSWLVAALGAVVVASLPDFWLPARVGGLLRRSRRIPGTYYRDALDVLVAVLQARQQGGAPDAYAIAATTRLAVARCENLLETLKRYGWAGEIEHDRWVLIPDPARLMLSDICRRFGIAPEELAAGRPDGPARQSFAALGAALDTALDIPLSSLAEGGATDNGPREVRAAGGPREEPAASVPRDLPAASAVGHIR